VAFFPTHEDYPSDSFLNLNFSDESEKVCINIFKPHVGKNRYLNLYFIAAKNAARSKKYIYATGITFELHKMPIIPV